LNRIGSNAAGPSGGVSPWISAINSAIDPGSGAMPLGPWPVRKYSHRARFCDERQAIGGEWPEAGPHLRDRAGLQLRANLHGPIEHQAMPPAVRLGSKALARAPITSRPSQRGTKYGSPGVSSTWLMATLD